MGCEITNFADRMLALIDKKQNPSVVGLDPRIEIIPNHIKKEAVDTYGDTLKAVSESFIAFNKGIINAIFDIVSIIKLQIAFYERYGVEGIIAFCKTVKYAKSKGLLIIEDAKRNDIHSTAKAYSNGHLGKAMICSGKQVPIFDIDAITINPYLGSNGIIPFIENAKRYDKGCFILVKTSNPSSIEFQDLLLPNGQKLFERIGKYVKQWGRGTEGKRGYGIVGAVVAATFPKQASCLRKIMRKTIFLSPGYGAQGAKGGDIIPLFNKDGYGAVISSSRDIIFAFERLKEFREEEYSEAARKAAIDMREDINKTLRKAGLLRQ